MMPPTGEAVDNLLNELSTLLGSAGKVLPELLAWGSEQLGVVEKKLALVTTGTVLDNFLAALTAFAPAAQDVDPDSCPK